MYKKVTTIKEYFGAKPKHHHHTTTIDDDDENIVKVDVPTLVSLMEYAKANLTDDIEFTNFAKTLLDAMHDDCPLTMDDYNMIMEKIRAQAAPAA